MLKTGQATFEGTSERLRLAVQWIVILGIAIGLPILTLKYAGKK